MTAPGQADADPAGPVPEDLPHLRRCVELAAEAVGAGDHPFGSVLVAGDGRVLAEDRNRENSAGDAWVGLGRIVYVSSSEQLIAWLAELGVPPLPVNPLPINQVAPGLVVQGPVPGLDEQVRELHRRFRS